VLGTDVLIDRDMTPSTWQQPSGATHIINVGAVSFPVVPRHAGADRVQGGFSFDPESLHADVGDFVSEYKSRPKEAVYSQLVAVWRFFPRNHSVVRAAYRYPCIPLEYIEPTVSGLYSGQRRVAAGEDEACSGRWRKAMG
jgi:hypothetical protein